MSKHKTIETEYITDLTVAGETARAIAVPGGNVVASVATGMTTIAITTVLQDIIDTPDVKKYAVEASIRARVFEKREDRVKLFLAPLSAAKSFCTTNGRKDFVMVGEEVEKFKTKFGKKILESVADIVMEERLKKEGEVTKKIVDLVTDKTMTYQYDHKEKHGKFADDKSVLKFRDNLYNEAFSKSRGLYGK